MKRSRRFQIALIIIIAAILLPVIDKILGISWCEFSDFTQFVHKIAYISMGILICQVKKVAEKIFK